VIGVLMGDQDRVEVLGILVDGSEPGENVAPA
jgi:hypothetical protein